MIRKISVQDIVSKHKESSSDDPNRHERDYLIERLTRKHTTASIADSPTKAKKQNSIHHKKRTSKRGRKWIWFVFPLILILLAFIVLQFMVSAAVTIKPKQLVKQIDVKLTASLNATTSSNTMMYQIITLSATDSETVSVTSTVSTKPQKASGQITIFNNYSSAPQTLIGNTRFETPEGLIYRIKNTISVPGSTTSGGKTVPGSITVTVTADQTGSKYNIDTADFTVPGLKTNAERYAKIFARSKTAMTGGSDGGSFMVSDATRQSAQTKIEARLRESLLRQAQSQKTADSVIFDTASKISFQRLSDTAGADAQHAVIHEQGTISAITFDKKTLGKMLLGNDAIASIGSNVEVHGIENLHFIAAVSSSSPIWQTQPFSFTLSGPIDAAGVVDTSKLLQDIRGIPRSDLTKILANYPTIDKASAIVKPFWKSSFPSDTSKIKIEIAK